MSSRRTSCIVYGAYICSDVGTHHARPCTCVCVVCTRRGRQKTRDGTREAQGQTRSRGSTRGQPSTSNSNQRRQTRCVNMTCLLRETWEVFPGTAYVAVRTAKEAFTTTRPGSPTCLLVTRDSVSLYLILPLYCLGENKISLALCATDW